MGFFCYYLSSIVLEVFIIKNYIKMTFQTKLDLNSNKFEQTSCDTLNLSGKTCIFSGITIASSGTLSVLSNCGTGKVLTSDANGNATWQTISASTYNLTSPSIFATGGMCAGTVLTGKTAIEILKEILAPELCGTLTSPSVSISLSPATLLYEIGCSISTLCVTGTFNRGCINPQYCSASDKRSGLANCYKFAGCQVVGSYACTTSPVTKCATGYTVCASQTWQVCTCYDAGVQPKGNAGSDFCTPLSAGVVCSPVCTISGIYPYYWGKVTDPGSRPAVTNSLVTGGTKVLASSAGVLQINFNSASNQYTWLAIPETIASKTCWYVTALDNGKVNNSPADKYPDECQLCISSGQICWSNICYKVYMSGTVGAISATLCFS